MKSRFAPSPTGNLHIGGARTALFAWLWAKNNNAKFVLRIEDTDTQRSTKQSVAAILDSMQWLGLEHDEGPYYQSDRFDRYKQVVAQLLVNNNAYYCQCTPERLQKLRDELMAQGKKPKYDGCCRTKKLTTGAVRFLNPDDGDVVIEDLVKGQIVINNTEIDDLIIARSNGIPTYNLTVVVDDYDMGITCVIRGDDHINNTPRQINLYRALNWQVPQFAHLPMILGDDGARLSKRNGVVSVMSYRDEGFLPSALLNYLVRLGWSHGNQEIFTIEQMITLFDLSNVNKAPSVFNKDKLLWLNQEYIKQASAKDLINELEWHLTTAQINITTKPDISAVVEFLQQRCKTLVEMADRMKIFYQDFCEFDSKAAKKQFKLSAKPIIESLIDNLSLLDNWDTANIHGVIEQVCVAQEVGFGKVGQPFRLALSGDGNAGSIDTLAFLLGKKKTLIRLNMALDYINNLILNTIK